MAGQVGRRDRVVVGAVLVIGVAVVSVLVLRPAGPPAPSLGDPRSVDPCGPLVESALAPLGAVRVDPDLGPLTSCTASVDGASGTHTVTVSLLAPGEFARPAPGRSVGDVEVSAPVLYPRGCGRYATLVDGTAVFFRTTTTRGAGPCPITDAAIEAGVGRLGAGAVGRRDPEPASVLARTDACTLVDPTTLASVPGVDAARVRAGFADASCTVGVDDLTAPYVTVEAVRQDLQPATTRIGRHEAFVSPVPGSAGEPGFCEVTLVQRGFSAVAGPRVEAVRLVYSGTPDQDEAGLCAAGTRLAAAAEAHLPDPT